MAPSFFNTHADPVRPAMAQRPADQPHAEGALAPSTGMAKDMVRGVSLMLMAAVMATLVLVTERVLLGPADVGNVLGWMVLWSVLLSALLLLSRLSVRVSQATLNWLDGVARRSARARAEARVGAPPLNAGTQ